MSCPHCASTDAVVVPSRFHAADLACRIAGYAAFRCRNCSERFYARRTPAQPVTPVATPKRRRKEVATTNPRDTQRIAELQNELAKAKAALATVRKDFAASNEALADQRARIARAEQEAAALRAEVAAAKTAAAEAREHSGRLEAQAAETRAAAPVAPPEGPRVDLEKMHLQSIAADLADALAEERGRSVRAVADGPRVDLEKMHLQGTAADLAAALDSERERSGRLESELAAAQAATPGVDVLRAELAKEVDRRTRLERDLKDIREGWAYDLARRRT